MVQRQPDNLIGQSNSFLEVLEHVSQLAPLDKPVLIVGERGTGKELIAARLHYLSARWDQTYVKMNCAAITESLLESELFGHEAGAFTGASKRHEGRFEIADRGTLFLDELATTAMRVQEKLLRVIEYGEFERVGGSKPVKVDVRLVAATNEDLPRLAEQGKFRFDLLDRLAFDVVTLPPLRERREDILLLADYFAVAMTRELKREFFAGFSRTAQQQLLDYGWPGNVRELKNVVERAVYRAEPDEMIKLVEFDPFSSPWRPRAGATGPASVSSPESGSSARPTPPVTTTEENYPLPFEERVAEFEIGLIKGALNQAQFNQKKAAELLSITYHQLRGLLKKYSLLDSN